jgi:sterol desaturase/sphingolipid hydroxylase (fatty acid hydroxylase superfamily)
LIADATHDAGRFALDAYMAVGQLGSFYLFAICAAVFLPLSLAVNRGSRQPVVHKGMIPDTIYWLVAPPLLYVPLTGWLFALLFDAGLYSVDGSGQVVDGLVAVRQLPVLGQAVVILLLMDLLQYWLHRLSHSEPFWKFHAIHHSATKVDWLTSSRFHPVDTIVRSYCVFLLVAALGFEPQAWLILVPFNTIYSPLVHANLDWDYGPLRYLLVSPAMHRWHHTHADEGGNSNFAPTFPFLDLLFGTYYAPKGVKPAVFGTKSDAVSDSNVFSQVIYPFR